MFSSLSGVCVCSLVPAVITHPAAGGNVRYTLATAPVGGYQLSAGSSGWFQYAAPPYIMQPPLTAVCIDQFHNLCTPPSPVLLSHFWAITIHCSIGQ